MSSPPTSFSMDNRIFRTFCCCMQFCIRSRLNNSTIFEFFLWVIRNCHCFEWRDTNIFPRDCRFLSIFYSFLHVRFVHKGLRSWFLFSFFFNVNRWHFIFLSSSFHTQCVCVCVCVCVIQLSRSNFLLNGQSVNDECRSHRRRLFCLRIPKNCISKEEILCAFFQYFWCCAAISRFLFFRPKIAVLRLNHASHNTIMDRY